MFWLRQRCEAIGPSDEKRQALEAWVLLRFQLASSDPMIALIGAFGRLTDAGMTATTRQRSCCGFFTRARRTASEYSAFAERVFKTSRLRQARGLCFGLRAAIGEDETFLTADRDDAEPGSGSPRPQQRGGRDRANV